MIYVAIVFLLIAALDAPAVLMEKEKKEKIFALVTYIVALSVTVLWAVGVKLPSPMLALSSLLKNVYK